jgi:hypothetical protein
MLCSLEQSEADEEMASTRNVCSYGSPKKAEDSFQVDVLGEIQKAVVAGNWQAAPWLLESKHPKRVVNKSRAELGVVTR